MIILTWSFNSYILQYIFPYIKLKIWILSLQQLLVLLQYYAKFSIEFSDLFF